MGKASTRAQNKYIAKAYDRVNLTLPKGQKDIVQAHAQSRSESVNGFIGRAITETMERDGSGTDVVNRDGGAGGPREAAERTGEAPAEFVARAVETQAKRDQSSLAMGITPAMGETLDKEG